MLTIIALATLTPVINVSPCKGPNLAEKFLEERKAKEENVATYSIVEC